MMIWDKEKRKFIKDQAEDGKNNSARGPGSFRKASTTMGGNWDSKMFQASQLVELS